jgi:hypothetical protein
MKDGGPCLLPEVDEHALDDCVAKWGWPIWLPERR